MKVILVLMLTSVTLLGQSTLSKKNILFYVFFNKGLKADIARGETTPLRKPAKIKYAKVDSSTPKVVCSIFIKKWKSTVCYYERFRSYPDAQPRKPGHKNAESSA